MQSGENESEQHKSDPLERLQTWLTTEVPGELARPGKLKFTINLDESRQDMKIVAERFYSI